MKKLLVIIIVFFSCNKNPDDLCSKKKLDSKSYFIVSNQPVVYLNKKASNSLKKWSEFHKLQVSIEAIKKTSSDKLLEQLNQINTNLIEISDSDYPKDLNNYKLNLKFGDFENKLIIIKKKFCKSSKDELRININSLIDSFNSLKKFINANL